MVFSTMADRAARFRTVRAMASFPVGGGTWTSSVALRRFEKIYYGRGESVQGRRAVPFCPRKFSEVFPRVSTVRNGCRDRRRRGVRKTRFRCFIPSFFVSNPELSPFRTAASGLLHGRFRCPIRYMLHSRGPRPEASPVQTWRRTAMALSGNRIPCDAECSIPQSGDWHRPFYVRLLDHSRRCMRNGYPACSKRIRRLRHWTSHGSRKCRWTLPGVGRRDDGRDDAGRHRHSPRHRSQRSIFGDASSRILV